MVPNVLDLGPQVHNATSHAATFARDAAGRELMYVVLDGASGIPARLAAVDLDTERVVLDRELPGSLGSWRTITAGDGSIYVGSYVEGRLYRYIPETDELLDLGRPTPNGTYVFALHPGEGDAIYGGTYPDASMFRYSPAEGFTAFGPSPVAPGELYARCNAYDPEHRISYYGVGSHAHLMRYDHKTGGLTDLLPPEYAANEFVYDLNLEGGRLFARLAPSLKLLVFDRISTTDGDDAVATGITERLIGEVPDVGCLGVSPELDGKVYYTAAGGILHEYDLAAGSYRSLDRKAGVFALRFGLVRLADQTRFPGTTLIGVGSRAGQTHVFKYNPASGQLAEFDVDIQGSPTNLQSVYRAADGLVYTGAFLVGGIGRYAPQKGASLGDRKGVGQTESMAELNGKMYFGVYPHAKLFEYDPSQPWTMHEGGNNPVKLFDLLNEEQDRPYGMTTGDGKLFVSTICGYGKLGGSILIYDPQTGERTVYRNPLTDLSIIRLVYRDGMLYAGTTIWGGLGIEPTQSEAQLLVFNTRTAAASGVRLPVAGLKAITALTEGPDGCLWGMAEGYLFIWDPQAEQFRHFDRLFPDIQYGSQSVWSDAALLLGRDGRMYGTAGGRSLFVVDPATMEHSILDDTGAKHLAADEEGHLYYTDGRTRLKTYRF